MIPHLAETLLFKTLGRRAPTCRVAQMFCGLLPVLFDDAAPLLEYIRVSFPAYTSHSIDHSLRVAQRVGLILSSAALTKLTSYELGLLLVSILLHDVGMVSQEPSAPNPDHIRRAHPRRSAAWLPDILRTKAPQVAHDRAIKVCQFVIESHGLTWDEMENRPEFSVNETIEGQIVRPRVLAILLRVGDLLDMDSDRTSDMCLRLCLPWISGVSLEHHNRHHRVQSFTYCPTELSADIECATRSEYDIWTTWLGYLKQDILHANTLVFHHDLSALQLPRPRFTIRRSAAADFELWELRFDIDDKGTLWDLISRSIYTRKHDFLRELTSNAVDATLRVLYDSPAARLAHASPRSWPAMPGVVVVVDNGHCAIIDDGIGMTKDDMRNYLFRVAASGGRGNPAQRAFPFASIGTFGLGFVSVLSKCIRASVRTRFRPSDDSPSDCYFVRLSSHFREAAVAGVPAAPFGTAIFIDLLSGYFAIDMANYLGSIFRSPTVPITIVNLVALHELLSVWPNEHSTLVAAIRADLAAGKTDAIVERSQLAVQATSALLQSLNRRISKLNTRREASNRQYLTRQQRLGVRNAAPPHKQLRSLSIPAGPPIRRLLRQALPEPPVTSTTIVVLDKNGRPVRAHDATKAVPDDGVGILIVPVTVDDMDLGVEWRSCHCFLVARGRVCDNAAFGVKFRSRRRDSYDRSLSDAVFMYSDEDEEETILERMLDAAEDDDVDLSDQEIGVLRNRIRMSREYSGFAAVEANQVHCSISDIRLDVDSDVDAWDDARGVSLFAQRDGPRGKARTNRHASGVLEGVGSFREECGKGLLQDGIALGMDISAITSVGCTMGAANLTAASRFPLNVTRSSLDEAPGAVDRWMERTGSAIVRRIAVEVRQALSSAGVVAEWQALWRGGGESEYCVAAQGQWNAIAED